VHKSRFLAPVETLVESPAVSATSAPLLRLPQLDAQESPPSGRGARRYQHTPGRYPRWLIAAHRGAQSRGVGMVLQSRRRAFRVSLPKQSGPAVQPYRTKTASEARNVPTSRTAREYQRTTVVRGAAPEIESGQCDDHAKTSVSKTKASDAHLALRLPRPRLG